MRRYQCHKRVSAAKITNIIRYANRDVLEFENGGATVSTMWSNKHQPKIGGYYVQYDDGYDSYSPAEAFESGYTLIE